MSLVYTNKVGKRRPFFLYKTVMYKGRTVQSRKCAAAAADDKKKQKNTTTKQTNKPSAFYDSEPSRPSKNALVKCVYSKDIFWFTSTSGDAWNITMLGKCHLCAVQCQKLKDLKLAYTLFTLCRHFQKAKVHTAHACGHVVHDFWLCSTAAQSCTGGQKVQ